MKTVPILNLTVTFKLREEKRRNCKLKSRQIGRDAYTDRDSDPTWKNENRI